jgi:hypothetical protein
LLELDTCKAGWTIICGIRALRDGWLLIGEADVSRGHEARLRVGTAFTT